MTSLLTRLEALTGPDREVSDLVLLSWGWRTETHDIQGVPYTVWHHPSHGLSNNIARPHPTASIDDALLGAPEGWEWNMANRGQIGSREGMCWATIMEPRVNDNNDSHAPTPALALCIAIVRARGGV